LMGQKWPPDKALAAAVLWLVKPIEVCYASQVLLRTLSLAGQPDGRGRQAVRSRLL
jgi:hypothetical protein